MVINWSKKYPFLAKSRRETGFLIKKGSKIGQFLAVIFDGRFFASSRGDGFFEVFEKNFVFLITFFHTVISKIPKKSGYFLWVFTHKKGPKTPKNGQKPLFWGFWPFFPYSDAKNPKKREGRLGGDTAVARRLARPRKSAAASSLEMCTATTKRGARIIFTASGRPRVRVAVWAGLLARPF